MEASPQDELILVFLLECIDLLHTQFEDIALSMLPSYIQVFPSFPVLPLSSACLWLISPELTCVHLS